MMNISLRLLRLARPQKFLGAMSLSTGAQLITLSLLVNKLSGLYGILALLTGFHVSSLQLSMYIYSVVALILTAYLSQHIRTQSPLQCLALAWFYVLDSIINAAYTAVFAMSWFLVLLQHNAGQEQKKGPGAGTIDESSGFTSPEHNVSSVEVNPVPGQDAVTSAHSAPFAAGAGGQGRLQDAVLSGESMNSIGIIIALWTVRLYFCIIMLGWARMVIRQRIALAGSRNTSYTAASTDSHLAENPFDPSKPEGQGWPGKLGRFLIGIARSYWLGKDEDDSWMYSMKFKTQIPSTEPGIALTKVEAGPTERERRRRSGTGPPPPPPELQSDGKTLQIPSPNL